jgi:hypothetical protein
LQLPTTFTPERIAELDVDKTMQAPPDDSIAWRGIGGAHQITAELCEFEEASSASNLPTLWYGTHRSGAFTITRLLRQTVNATRQFHRFTRGQPLHAQA